MSMRKRTTARQFQLMVDFIELHPKLVFGKLDSNFTVKDRQRLWDELTSLLNSDQFGSARDAEKWRKSWNDLKNTIKQKLASLARNHSDGSFAYLRLSPLEEKVVRMIGSTVNEDGSSNGCSYITVDQMEKLTFLNKEIVLNEETLCTGRNDGGNILEQVINIPFANQSHLSLKTSTIQCANREDTEDDPNATNDNESSQYAAVVFQSTESSSAVASPVVVGSSTTGSTVTNMATVYPTVLPRRRKTNFTNKGKKKFKKRSLLEFLKTNDRRKVIALERMAAAEERKAAAAEKKAEVLKEMADTLSGYLSKLPT